jgi:hypothetical protein
MIVFGTRYYGKCDQVPGLFYVATLFHHVQFVPLVPTGTFLILDNGEKNDEHFTAYRIPFSIRSMLLGWVRAILWSAAIAGCLLASITAINMFIHQRPLPWHKPLVEGAVGVGSTLLLAASYRLTRAGPLRALRLAAQVGIPPEEVAKYYVNHPNIESIIEELNHGQQETFHR